MDETATDATTITTHERWADGDFAVITTDNVQFLVPSYYLFAAR